jgi:hypothetical protein
MLVLHETSLATIVQRESAMVYHFVIDTVPKTEDEERQMKSSLAICMVIVLAPGIAWSFGNDDMPRRADGRPDLSGTYDIATLTPVQRNQQYGDRLELSDDEAAKIADHWRTNFEKDYEAADPDREAPPKGGVGIYAPEFTGAAGKVGGYNAGFVDIGESTFKLDGKWRTSIVTSPVDGRMPSPSKLGVDLAKYTSQYRHENTGTAWWMDLEVGPYDHPEYRPLAERCLLARGASGPPMLPSMYNNIKRVVQTDDHLTIMIEWMHDVRTVPIVENYDPSGFWQESESAATYPEELRKWSGNSVGFWQGDTLVVHTTHFREDSGIAQPFVDKRVEERFSRIDGDTLRYQFTVQDPTLEDKWSGEMPWPATENKMYEYACHEGNYAMGTILKGARLLEKEALEGAESPSGRD